MLRILMDETEHLHFYTRPLFVFSTIFDFLYFFAIGSTSRVEWNGHTRHTFAFVFRGGRWVDCRLLPHADATA